MLTTLVFLLAASVVFVSISRKLGLGSILGYLVAGAVIGPSGLRLVTDIHVIQEISEFGVLMLLFLIGLELRPQRIWLMRRAVFGLGAAQVFVTGAALGGLIFFAFGLEARGAAILGLGLALSSTAIVLPMLGERDLLGSGSGRDAFAVLLFQDLASIPLVSVLPLLGDHAATGPIWPPLLKGAAAVAVILFGGRYLVRPLFRTIGRIKTTEIFTATALLTIAGAAVVADLAGLPMSLGAFAAGVILSESEYRHELQVDIEPFEGLLLGFFFISIGMAANIGLAVSQPSTIALSVLGLVGMKLVIAFVLERLRGQNAIRALRFALALPQGSEFGFVLFGAALAAGVLAQPAIDKATLVVALSMAVSPLLFALSERFVVPRLIARAKPVREEPIDAAPAPVIIAGFGRVGQIVGRIMKARKIAFNALDNDADNIDTVRRFGSKAFFGDPTRLELLRAVGAQDAKVLVVTLGDPTQSLELVERAKEAFPHLRIYARARNRRHAHLLMNIGIEAIVRETFFSSLRLTELVLQGVGLDADDARRTVQAFRERDEKSLILQQDMYDDEKRLIQSAKQAARELEQLFEEDAEQEAGA
jgi:CPA2 family monovalent cation:H+ antiporter-2/glutathione-regulated potassium-efflux system protein KefB